MTPPRTTVRGLVLRVRVRGPALDGAEAASSWQSLARGAAGRAVILDLAGVTRMDAAGLGILAGFAEAVRARGGCLRVARLHPRVRRLIEATGLAGVVGLYDA